MFQFARHADSWLVSCRQSTAVDCRHGNGRQSWSCKPGFSIFHSSLFPHTLHMKINIWNLKYCFVLRKFCGWRHGAHFTSLPRDIDYTDVYTMYILYSEIYIYCTCIMYKYHVNKIRVVLSRPTPLHRLTLGYLMFKIDDTNFANMQQSVLVCKTKKLMSWI